MSSRPTTEKKKSSATSILVVVVLAMVGAAVFMYRRSASNTATEATVPAGPESTIVLDSFVVNLNGGDRAYLRVGLTLAVTKPLPTDKEEGLSRVARLRDTILDVLTTARPEDLLQPEGKRKLKTEILHELQQRAPESGVKDVYFTEFLVQM